MFDVDLFVVGAGSGGVRAARMAAGMGARVAIAEDRYMGGTCVNVGCVPKKLYSYAAHYSADFADSAGFGWTVGDAHFSWPLLRDNKKKEISRLNGIYLQMLEKAGVTVHHGRAELRGPHEIGINDQLIRARYILLATGGWPQVPDLPGREHLLTSNEIFDLETLPQRLLVLGGGYIAVEFAGIFSGLGSTVTLAYRGDKVLRGFDEDLRTRFMTEAGRHVNLLMHTDVAGITRNADGSLSATMKDGHVLVADAILAATGRKARTQGLGLEHTAVQLDARGNVQVDAEFRTTEPSIYALGDVVGRMALTPVALAEGMFLADHLFGSRSRRMSYDNIATAVFCQPNIATVGLSEEAARKRHGNVTVYESEFRHLRHTLSGRPERTYMKIIVDTATDKVVGMHMLGADAGEIIQGFAAAMVAGITKQQLDSTIGIHPTAAEEFVTMRTSRKEKG
jgi:glutathione reductase (NADPH)